MTIKESTIHKYENGKTQIYLWCFIKKDKPNSYQKEAHIHSDKYFNFTVNLDDEEEYEEELKKLEESDEFKVKK